MRWATYFAVLEFKADPQIANDKNQLPIAGAAFKGNLPVVKALIEGGAVRPQ